MTAKCIICGEYQAEICSSCAAARSPVQRAAPELLEALVKAEKLLRIGQRNNIFAEAAEQAAAAIAKATQP